MKNLLLDNKKSELTAFKKIAFVKLILISLIICLSLSANAQAKYFVTVINNNSTCTYDVKLYDSSPTQIGGTISPGPGNSASSACADYSDNLTTITVTNGTRCVLATFTIAGGWAQTLNQGCTPVCGGGATYICTTNVTSTPFSVCGGTTTEEIIITIN